VATQQAEQQGRPTSEGAKEKTQEIAAQAKEQVQQTAGDVKQKASDQMRQQLNVRSTELGGQADGYARALDAAAERLQQDGDEAGARAAHQAREQVQRLSGYLIEADADRFIGDLEAFSRRRPWAAAALGFASGFVAARFLKASAEGRYQGSRPPRELGRPYTPTGEATVYGAP